MESAPIQIEAGELTIIANVNIVFEIEGRIKELIHDKYTKRINKGSE